MWNNRKYKILTAVCLSAVLVLGAAPRLCAQRSEIGVGAGISFYLGDINPSGVFYKPKFSAGLFYRYNIDTRWAVRISGNYGRIEAYDADFDNPRALNFRNDIVDLAAMMEVNFVNFFTGAKQHRFTPYIAFGAALAFSNPYGLYPDPEKGGDKRWVTLRDLHTEGQGLYGYDAKEYSRAVFAVPFGLGFKVSISKHVALGLEWIMRWAVTDYLDDVSGTYADPGELRHQYNDAAGYFADPQGFYDENKAHAVGAQRGDRSSFDWYSFTHFTVSIRLDAPEKSCPAYSGQTKLQMKRRR